LGIEFHAKREYSVYELNNRRLLAAKEEDGQGSGIGETNLKGYGITVQKSDFSGE
jgi:hypothetical protein